MKSGSLLACLGAIGVVCGASCVVAGGLNGQGTINFLDKNQSVNLNMIRPASETKQFESSPAAFAKAFSSEYSVSGPYTSKNLQIYLMSGHKNAPEWPFIAIHDAIEKKKAIVEETGNVNELSVTNNSDRVAFIHSGDILKGGNQDRMSQYDVLVPPRHRLPLPAFCVEHGRWTRRGVESSENFTVPKAATLPSYIPARIKGCPDLQGATNGSIGPMIAVARLQGDQQEVWNNVSKAQADLSVSTGCNVQDPVSDSSLELTLEGPAMQKARLPYINPLANLPSKSANSIGYLAFVDGKYVAGDSYVNHALFEKMWPKMLCVRATDAIVATKQPLTPSSTSLDLFDEVKFRHEFLPNLINFRTIQVERHAGRLALFKTMDAVSADDGDAPIHVTISRL